MTFRFKSMFASWSPFKKRFLLYTTLLLGTGAFAVSQAYAGSYDTVSPPSIIPTAYQDAQKGLEKGKQDASSSGDKDADKQAAESKDNLNANVSTLMGAGNFGSVGLLFGPVSGNSSIDAYGTLTNTQGLDKAGMQTFNANTGGNNKVFAYHTFGLAMTHLKEAAETTSPTVMNFDRSVDAFEEVCKSFANFGIALVKAYNPLPVVAAFYDSSYLNNPAYTGNQNGGNKLIQLINSNDTLSSIIRLFGDSVSVGTVHTSRSFVITGTIVFFMFGYAAFSRLWNGQRVSIILRKNVVKIVIAAVAVPLVSTYGSQILQWTDDLVSSKAETKEERILSNNLNIYNWYKNASFGLPNGTSLEVKNGYFVFTPTVVRQINEYASMNRVSAIGSAELSAAVREVLGDTFSFGFKKNKVPKIKKPKNRTTDEIADEIISMSQTDRNKSRVIFTPSYRQSTGEKLLGGASPWDTSSLAIYADALSSNKEYKPEKDNVVNNPYVDVNGLTASGSGTSYTYTSNGGGYGVSPMAAYNLMATTFSESGFSVKTNTGAIITPTIATSIITSTDSQTNVPSIVKLVVLLSMITVSMQAIVTIITGGFGGVFKGGVGSVVGSAAGFGQLIGGVIAITIGMFGLSIIMMIAVELLDMLWGFLMQILFSNEELKDALNEISDGFLGILKYVPFLKGIINSVVTLVLTVVGILTLPKMVKTPILAYGEWVGGLPQAFGERIAQWEKMFTGDYHNLGGSFFGGSRGGGGSMFGGGGSGALSKMQQKEDAKRAAKLGAAKTGAAMMAGAGLSLLGASIANKADQHNQGVNNAESLTRQEGDDTRQDLMAQENEQDNMNNALYNADEAIHDNQEATEIQETPIDDVSDLPSVQGPETARIDDTANEYAQSLNDDDYAEGAQVNDADVDASTQSIDDLSLSDAYAQMADASMLAEGDNVNEQDSLAQSTGGDQINGDTQQMQSQQEGDQRQQYDTRQVDQLSENNQQVSQAQSLSSAKQDTHVSSSQSNPSHQANTQQTLQDATNFASNHASLHSVNPQMGGDVKQSTLNQANAQVNQQQSVSNQSRSTSTQSPSSKRESRLSRVRANEAKQSARGKALSAIGHGMQALGGQMVGQEHAAKDAGKMAAAGALHIAGALTGTQALTGRVAQRQIDKRNERLMRSGKDIPDNLSARGESRQEIRKRIDANIQRANLAMQEQQGANSSPSMSTHQAPSMRRPMESTPHPTSTQPSGNLRTKTEHQPSSRPRSVHSSKSSSES